MPRSTDFGIRYHSIVPECIQHIGATDNDGIKGHIHNALALLAKENVALPTVFDYDPMGELVGR